MKKRHIPRLALLQAFAGILILVMGIPASAIPRTPWAAKLQEPIIDGVGNLPTRSRVITGSRPGVRIIGESVPKQGRVKLLAIPVEFARDQDITTSGDGTFPYRTWGPAKNEGYLQGSLQRLSAYYNEVSGHRISLECTLGPKVTLPDPMSTYGDQEDATLMDDVVLNADMQINFSPYDIIVLIHAGAGEEVSLDPNSKDIWSHFMPLYLQGKDVLDNEMLKPVIPTNDGVDIGAWVVVPETQCSDTFFTKANPGLNILTYEVDPSSYPNPFIPQYWDPMGTWAHEVGHAFGLPDLYDTGIEGKYEGLSLGNWSVMAQGSYLPMPTEETDPGMFPWDIPNDPARPQFGSCPCHLDAWCKKVLGWTAVSNVTGRLTDLTIPAQGASQGVVYRMWRDGSSSSSEYFLAENRSQVGYDRYVPESGLMIYHIDDNAGSFTFNNVQADGRRPRVKPLSADNTLEVNDLGQNGFTYEPKVDTVFPGRLGVTHVGSNTTPNTSDYAGSLTYVDLNNIRLVGTNILVDLQTVGPSGITFLAPQTNAILYVTRPTIRALAPSLDPATIVVQLNGIRITSASYNAEAGEVTAVPGELSVGSYTLDIRGTDRFLGVPMSATTIFEIRERNLNAGLQMIALPTVNVGKAANVFVGINQLQLARWDPATGQYIHYNAQDPSTDIDAPAWSALDTSTLMSAPPAGKAYWVNLPTGCILRLAGDMVHTGHTYSIPMQAGFNMIGNPFPFAVAFGALQVEYNGHTYGITDAVQQRLIDSSLFWWTGRGYTVILLPQGTLQPWMGYWIHARVGSVENPLKLIFQPAPVSSSMASAALTRSKGTNTLWQFGVKALEIGTGYEAGVTLGAQQGATNGIDPGIDVYAPPASPAGISLVSQTGRGAGALCYDYRAAVDGGSYAWNLQVTGTAGSSIALSWPDLTGIPGKYAVILTDLITGTETYLRTSPAYTVKLGAQETSRALQVTITPDRNGGLLITNVQVVHTRAAGGVAISCQLSAPANVSVEIRTVSGRVLKRLTSTSRAQGAVSFTWDGKDARGRAVPRGTYQCLVTAVAGNGKSVKALTLLPY